MKSEEPNNLSSLPNKYALYLFDLGPIIKERSFRAKIDRDASPRPSAEYDFNAGRVLGFNEIISILQDQARAFGIPLEDLRIQDIDPDKDLV